MNSSVGEYVRCRGRMVSRVVVHDTKFLRVDRVSVSDRNIIGAEKNFLLEQR